MQVEFVTNGGVTLMLCPENEMEEHLLKQMMKQDNDMTEIRMNVTILNKIFKNGVLIGKKSTAERIPIESIKTQNATEEETL
jgi:hypothetical protein